MSAMSEGAGYSSMKAMKDSEPPYRVLLAESGEKESREFERAWIDSGSLHPLDMVHDADEVIHYLHAHAPKNENDPHRLPGLVVLCLEISQKRGLEVLGEIKRDPLLRRTPVIVMTRNSSPEIVDRSYDLGASAFIRLPADDTQLHDYVRRVVRFWEASEPPSSNQIRF